MSQMQDASHNLSIDRTDRFATLAKAALGATPIVGPFLQELIGAIIPRQRIDRLAAFARHLEDRLRKIEETVIHDEIKDEAFTDLVEDALHAAVLSTSDERRQYIATLVANSLTVEAEERAESKHLLRLLGELTDIELIWLRSYVNRGFTGRGDAEDSEFRKRHSAILAPVRTHFGSSQNALDKGTLQHSYRDHLVSLGLLERRIDVDSQGNPRFDKTTKAFTASYQSSSLGRLLLRSIGLMSEGA